MINPLPASVLYMGRLVNILISIYEEIIEQISMSIATMSR